MPKPEHGYGKPLTEGGKLSDRGKKKLQSQKDRARAILDKEEAAGRRDGEEYAMALRLHNRTVKLLGGKRTQAPKPKKAKSETKGGAAARRRKPFEKGTGTGRIKALLEKSGEAARKRAGTKGT